MGLLSKLHKRPQVQVVPAETLGLFDLSHGEAADLVAADSAALGPLFRHVQVETARPPRCSVLLVYGRFARDGTIPGCSLDLGEMVSEAAAAIVVIATPHSGGRYISMRKRSSYTPANLVMTVDRKGDAFGAFFGELFTEMKKGASMPAAWVKLAPQVGELHEELPDTIFDCGLGHITFCDPGR